MVCELLVWGERTRTHECLSTVKTHYLESTTSELSVLSANRDLQTCLLTAADNSLSAARKPRIPYARVTGKRAKRERQYLVDMLDFGNPVPRPQLPRLSTPGPCRMKLRQLIKLAGRALRPLDFAGQSTCCQGVFNQASYDSQTEARHVRSSAMFCNWFLHHLGSLEAWH